MDFEHYTNFIDVQRYIKYNVAPLARFSLITRLLNSIFECAIGSKDRMPIYV
jgi:hypothetical protein